MADTHEEQLLNDLLRDLGTADEPMRGADLEARVLAAWDADHLKGSGGLTPFSRASYVLGIAAMVTLAVMVTLWKVKPSASTSAPELPSASAFAPGASASAAAPLPPSREALRRTGRRDEPVASVAPVAPIAPIAPVAPIASTFAANAASVDKPIAPVAPVAPDLAQAPIEFVPLLPMTEQELTGSFQIVRVQMPRASLGALATGPMHHPGELVEADVLLGEDGRARAIHISTSGSVSPWRPR